MTRHSGLELESRRLVMKILLPSGGSGFRLYPE
jgi:hypothetical protein